MRGGRQTEERMICSNCGAEFDGNEPKCPYCGQLAPSGAERAHMEKLRALEQATEELGEIPEELYRQDLRRQSKRLLIIVGIAAGVVLLFILLSALT